MLRALPTLDPLFQPGCSLDEVIVTDELAHRPGRRIDVTVQQRALDNLKSAMDGSPEEIFQALVDNILQLCNAQSAGISVEDVSANPPIFRWHAVAGRMADFVGGTMPRYFSPCCDTLARNEPVLMRDLVRHYPYACQLNIALEEVLLVPFAVAGRPVGTVWVVAHTPDRHFGRDEVKCISSFTNFASAAVTLLQNLDRINTTNARLDRLAKSLRTQSTPPL